MNKQANTKDSGRKTIAVNKRAFHDYTLEERFEAGIVLNGWEVKSLRAGKLQIAESYVLLKKGEAFLIGSHISPLLSASTHVRADATRTRKLLFHRKELNKLIGLVERRGYTLIPLSLYWNKGRAKLEVALMKGKKEHDKRATENDRVWEREKQRLFKKTR